MSEILTRHSSEIFSLELKRDSFIVLASARRTGKSFAMAELLYYFLTDPDNKVDYIYLFSETAGLKSGTNKQYDFLDRKCIIHPKHMEHVINGLLLSQNASRFQHHVLVAFDDIDMGQRYRIIEKLATLGRHHLITTILSAQIANTAVSPAIRNNITYLFWRRLNNKALEGSIFPIVGLAFGSPRELCDFTHQAIGDYNFCFYNNDQDYDPDSSLLVVRAQPIPDDFKYQLVTRVDRREAQRERRVHNIDPYVGRGYSFGFENGRWADFNRGAGPTGDP